MDSLCKAGGLIDGNQKQNLWIVCVKREVLWKKVSM